MIPRTAAATVLDVPPDATPAAARAAFLRLVSAADFVPPEDACVAANVVAGVGVPLSYAAHTDAAVAFREAVDGFADAYWRTDPPHRRLARAALAACGPPPADARFLEHLRRAEDVFFDSPADPSARELAELARDLYRMRPRPRAARRAEWLDARDAWTDWEAVAKGLKTTAPEVARLDRPLFGILTNHPTLGPTAPLPAAKRSAVRYVARAAPPAKAPARTTTGWWPIGIVVVVVIRLIMAIVPSGPAARPSPPVQNPRLERDLFQNPRVEFPGTRPEVFSDAEILGFRAYDAKSGPTEPPRYQLWRAYKNLRRPEAQLKAERKANVPRGDAPTGTRK